MVWFLSADVELCEMLLHAESAFDSMIELGYFGRVQFVDPPASEKQERPRFRSELERCRECLMIISALQADMEKYNINIVFYPDVDKEYIPRIEDLSELEDILQNTVKELQRSQANFDPMRKARLLTIEEKYVLEKADEFLTGERNTVPIMAWTDSIIMKLVHDESSAVHTTRDVRLGFLMGSISAKRYNTFERVLWRITHGNIHIRHNDEAIIVEDWQNPGEMVIKYMFMVFFVGSNTREKVAKICDGFRANLFECPDTKEERALRGIAIEMELRQFEEVFRLSHNLRLQILGVAAADHFIWKIKLKKMLIVFLQLNKFRSMQNMSSDNYLQLLCWIPSRRVKHVQRLLMCAARRSWRGGDIMMYPPILQPKKNTSGLTPPTHYALNDLTAGFQRLIDAYGTACYKELNPAPFTLITFPFLFAVMFGDVGHGLIILLFAWYMIRNEKYYHWERVLQSTPDEIWNMLFAGRYILLLMGIFSIYTGLIYNVVFAKSLNIFGSGYRVNYTESVVLANTDLQLDPRFREFYRGTPYFFGMDPVWGAAGDNAITTFNSLKMKLAILLGVCQMTFGYLLSATNYSRRHNHIDLYYVFVPQIIFLLALFGYLAFLIVYKWIKYGAQFDPPNNSACAPSLLIVFINMVLMKGLAPAPPGCHAEMYEYQEVVQYLLLAAAMISVPVLLIVKPYKLYKRNRHIDKLIALHKTNPKASTSIAASQAQSQIMAGNSIRTGATMQMDIEAGQSVAYINMTANTNVTQLKRMKHDMGEIWIHQGILCIESVLGAVSHTASYLRLWALSLAHDQLSSVLWNMLLRIGLVVRINPLVNAVVLCVIFAMWASLTIAILVVMEGLSAFLHTLRLHWVEFQSKFFKGTGDPWMPFHFPRTTAEMVHQK